MFYFRFSDVGLRFWLKMTLLLKVRDQIYDSPVVGLNISIHVTDSVNMYESYILKNQLLSALLFSDKRSKFHYHKIRNLKVLMSWEWSGFLGKTENLYPYLEINRTAWEFVREPKNTNWLTYHQSFLSWFNSGGNWAKFVCQKQFLNQPFKKKLNNIPLSPKKICFFCYLDVTHYLDVMSKKWAVISFHYLEEHLFWDKQAFFFGYLKRKMKKWNR